ncbi:30964_t:CDS:1, partial [Gigaspora margarita]
SQSQDAYNKDQDNYIRDESYLQNRDNCNNQDVYHSRSHNRSSNSSL